MHWRKMALSAVAAVGVALTFGSAIAQPWHGGPRYRDSGRGCQIIVYEDADYGGQARRYFRDQSFLEDGWNDRISSFKIVSGDWAFFWDADFSGGSFSAGRDVRYVGDRWNDKISSIRCLGPGRRRY